jgi:yeast amino acid transporter
MATLIANPHPQFSGWIVFLKDHWETDTFITNYLPVALFPIMFVGCKVYRKTRFVRVEEMDFVSGVEEVVRDRYVHVHPTTLLRVKLNRYM